VKIDARRRTALTVLGGLLVMAIPTRVVWGLRSSALNEASAIREETSARQVELTRAKKAKANQPQLKAALAEMTAAMPATPDLQSLLDTLSTLAADTNVSWEVLSAAVPQIKTATTVSTEPTGSASSAATTVPSAGADSASAGGGDTGTPSAAASTGTSFAFDATVSGDDASVSAFLDRLRSIDRLVVVDKVQLNWNRSAAGTGGGVNARLSMRAFIWKGGAKAGAAAPSTTAVPTEGDAVPTTVRTVGTTVAP
jgi:hypothetical protein